MLYIEILWLRFSGKASLYSMKCVIFAVIALLMLQQFYPVMLSASAAWKKSAWGNQTESDKWILNKCKFSATLLLCYACQAFHSTIAQQWPFNFTQKQTKAVSFLTNSNGCCQMQTCLKHANCWVFFFQQMQLVSISYTGPKSLSNIVSL